MPNVNYPNLDQTTHGESHKTPEYSAWSDMKKRCYQPRYINYKNYGGRGVSVCHNWLNSYLDFLHCVGRRPSKGHSLDRINSEGNYEPGNVRWATAKEQAQNRRTSLIVEGKCLKQRCEEQGLNYKTVWMRLNRQRRKNGKL